MRVVNGGYETTHYVMPSILANRGQNHDGEAPSDEEAPRPLNNEAVKTRNRPSSLHESGIQTVVNAGCLFTALQRWTYFCKTGKCVGAGLPQQNVILKDINLRFESGKVYLVLGAPGSGKVRLQNLDFWFTCDTNKKGPSCLRVFVSSDVLYVIALLWQTTLLKYITHLLQEDKDHILRGQVCVNGVQPTDGKFEWTVSML